MATLGKHAMVVGVCGCCGGRCDACGDVRCIRCSVGGKYCGVVYYVVVYTNMPCEHNIGLGCNELDCIGLDWNGCRLGVV